jgi:D-serine deaminase-like pyridoxal phosphate-dependent protein
MIAKCKAMQVNLRPHIKVQKCAELALLEVQAGAIGVCCATVWEAIVMARAGIADVLIANQIGGRQKIQALAQAAKKHHLTVAVDDPGNASELSAAVSEQKARLDCLIEVDVGMGRGGVRSVREGVELARKIAELPGLNLRGVQGYEGHCMHEREREVRAAKAKAAMDQLCEVVEALRKDGHRCEVVSAGGTGTYDLTGTDRRVTELQAGSFIFMDLFHAGLVPGFEHSLTVLTTATIRHGQTIVFDAGRKSIGIDFVQPFMAGHPEWQARYFAEEHALFDVDERCPIRRNDVAELLPGYAPTTVNLYDAYHVVEKGVVVDIWPVVPRGAGHGGIL